MKFSHASLLLALLAAAPSFAQNVATVNGKAIPSSRADMMVKQATSQGQPDTPELRKMVKDQLVEREILVQEGERLGFAKSAEFKDQLEMTRQQLVIRGLIQDYVKKHELTDAELKAEYAKYKEMSGGKEYNARHILVEKEEDAKAIITKLKGGAKFEELAKASKDPGSAANGGALDWSPASNYVPEFGDALKKLAKGKFTETPVKTQFGFHVIRLEDSRDAKLASMEEMKPQLTQAAQQKKLQAYVEELKKKAKVQ